MCRSLTGPQFLLTFPINKSIDHVVCLMMMKMIAKRSAAKLMFFFILFIINSIIDNGYWRAVHVVYIIMDVGWQTLLGLCGFWMCVLVVVGLGAVIGLGG